MCCIIIEWFIEKCKFHTGGWNMNWMYTNKNKLILMWYKYGVLDIIILRRGTTMLKYLYKWNLFLLCNFIVR